ncbi:MAG: NADH-quinone oxidoreductase subunit H [Oscillospiraceae bacterium]|nr:NADH-quinone oxidoreductase subunit H [Oscillospiraceae bacterium]MBQ4315766.1 NADH-quinone oxidoreductase subunit H [Oscillospiraceae bacterium]MBQ7054063.1 NADH-quinone oxidoreductase subunit H [Oscillospiraceae bacterium]MBR2180603.1 NADH-quinone oxidoreductase subunit H [Oscillospiraceae bacterium]
MLTNAWSVLVFPGLLFAVVVGLLLAGIDRKILARMQKRKGPPILQPTYDFFKLMGKETIIPHAANRKAFLIAPVLGFVSLVVLMLFIPVFGYSPFSTNGDLIIVLYLLTIPAVALIVGGSASGSPYAGIGISREMVTMMAYELPLVVVLLTVAKKVGGESLVFSLGEIGDWQAANGLLISHWALIPAAIAMLLVIPAEVGTQPFDVAEAETEICEGPLVEYSGAPLAVFKLNTAIKMFVMTSLFTVLFFGGIDTGYIALNAVILVAICSVLTVICMTLAHAICARLKIEHLFKFYWTVVTALAAISLILVWLGL